MKKIKIYVLILSLFSVFACTKERLIITEKKLQFDENSPEYQSYQAERAMEYIRMYRFEKLGDVLNKLNDPVVKQNLQDSLRKYRNIAETQALYVVTPANDSLFFIPPENTNPTLGDEVWLGTNFLASYSKMPNARGVVQGFKNFPKTTLFYFLNHLGTGIKGLEELPDMKKFTWGVRVEDVVKAYPEQEFEYVSLQADLSKNQKLEDIFVFGIQLGNITYPKHQLKSFLNMNNALGGGLKMPTGSFDELWVEKIIVGGEADPDFKITGARMDNFTFSAPVKTLDISKSAIKTLVTTNAQQLILPSSGLENLSANPVEKTVLPQGLKALSLDARNLKEHVEFPRSLKKLTLQTYTYEPAFSHLDQLDTLDILYTTYKDYTGNRITFNANTLSMPSTLKHFALRTAGYYNIEMSGATLPQSLQSIYLTATIKAGIWDISHLSNLKELVIYTTTVLNGEIDLKLPPNIEKINFSSSTLPTNTFDISMLTNLHYLKLGSFGEDNLVTLILPVNLRETALINALNQYGNVKPISLKNGSTIVNKPSWFDQYVQYY